MVIAVLPTAAADSHFLFPDSTCKRPFWICGGVDADVGVQNGRAGESTLGTPDAD